jgi:hypothetical protein
MFIEPIVFTALLFVVGLIGALAATAAFALKIVRQSEEELKATLDKRRHTYPTANGLEDATAVAIDIALNEQAQAEWREIRLNQLRRILGEVREGPLAYNDERPADRPPRPDGRGKR